MADEENFPRLDDDDASWRVLHVNDRFGPYRLSDLLCAISEGTIKSSDLIWHPGWSDWREVGSVAGLLSPSLADMFDCEPRSSPPANPTRMALVHKFEFKLRPRDPKKSWFEQLLHNDHLPLIANLLLIAITIVVLAALSALIFDNSRQGIFYLMFEFMVFFSICVGIIGRSKAIRISSVRFAAPPAMAVLLLVAMNGDRLPDAFDAWQGKRLAWNLRTLTQVEHVAQDHPSNKFLALLLASHNANQQSTTAVRQLIDNFHAQAITLDAVLVASTRDRLNKQAQDLRAAEARTTLAWSDYLQILEAERSEVEQAGSEIYRDDPLHLAPKVMKAHASRQEILRQHMDKTFQTIAALLSGKGDLAEFMALHFDQIRTPRTGALTVFADQATNDQLKKMVAAVRAAQTKVAELDRDNRIFNADQNGLRNVIASAM